MRRPDHIARARDAWPFLVRLAISGGQPYTYKQLSGLIGVHHRAARYYLHVIQAYCEKQGWPRLTALVVQAHGKRMPGEGFHGAHDPAGHDKNLADVRRFAWPPEAPF